MPKIIIHTTDTILSKSSKPNGPKPKYKTAFFTVQGRRKRVCRLSTLPLHLSNYRHDRVDLADHMFWFGIMPWKKHDPNPNLVFGQSIDSGGYVWLCTVTLYIKMSYGSHVKIKILSGLLLDDFKNFKNLRRVFETPCDCISAFHNEDSGATSWSISCILTDMRNGYRYQAFNHFNL